MIESSITWSWKVLLADDDPVFHEIGSAKLNGLTFDSHQIEIFTSHDEQSTCLFLKENPDTALVVLDIHMDEATSGYKVIEYIRNNLNNNEVRILLHSADSNIESEEAALELYAISGYLSKIGLAPNMLVTKVKQALRSYSDIRHIQKLAQSNSALEKEVAINTRQLLDLSAKMQIEILKRKDSENQLQKFNEQLEAEVLKRTQAAQEAQQKAINASQAKTDFLSRMSHELRTPLNAILGFSQLLLSPKASTLDARQHESIDQITIAGKHLLYLVSEILDLSKIEAGKLTVNIDALDIIPIINNCITTLLSSAKLRNITMSLVDPPEQLWIMGDHVRTKQVVLNILSNAIKYGPENDEIQIRALVNDDKGLITVQDNGEGISEKMQEFLYTPFERCKNSEADVEGTGVGLAITKKLIELMFGQVGFENLSPKGCLFTLTFPKVQI